MRNCKVFTSFLTLTAFLVSANFFTVFAYDPNISYMVIGDGSGGGGGGGGNGSAGGDGGGDNDTLDLSTSTKNNVIFGDGSGGGAGGRGIGYSVTRGGKGGSGADIINGGSGNDIIFGDGFDGIGDSDGGFFPGKGGLGGAGGGGAGGGFANGANGTIGGLCGGGGGAGANGGVAAGMFVACTGATNGGYGGSNGGNSAITTLGIQGMGGVYGVYHSGGGGALGGANGGYGGGTPLAGGNGNTDQHFYVDAGGLVYTYLTNPSFLWNMFVDYPNYGAGNDTINAGGGSNELYGLGGQDNFVVDSVNNATLNRIWDFSAGDKIVLKNNGTNLSQPATQAILDAKTIGDYDGDTNSDDYRLVFNSGNIDLINTSAKTLSATSGEIAITNAIPLLSIAQTPLAYTPGASAIAIDAAGTLSDPDGDAEWNGGTLKIQISSNSESADTLSLSGTDISIVGDTNIKFAGNYIGAVSAAGGTVTGGTELKITFDSGATNAIVQSILRGLRFATNPAGSIDRIVTVTATDLSGASVAMTRTIDVAGASAIASYTMTFDSQGGSAVSSITQLVGSSVTLPQAPTRSGYNFVAWSTTADDSGTIANPGDAVTMPGSNSTKYARWSAVATASAQSSTTSNVSTSTTSAPVCNDAKPVGAPDLFQINTTKNTAKLYFTPLSSTNYYYIAFSTSANAEEHGEEVVLAREGVQSETINLLSPKTTYYFKVRGQDGCAPGDWSNIMSATTDNSIFYSNMLPIKTMHTFVFQTAVKAKEPIVNSVLSDLPTASPTPQAVAPKAKKCFLWWCW